MPSAACTRSQPARSASSCARSLRAWKRPSSSTSVEDALAQRPELLGAVLLHVPGVVRLLGARGRQREQVRRRDVGDAARPQHVAEVPQDGRGVLHVLDRLQEDHGVAGLGVVVDEVAHEAHARARVLQAGVLVGLGVGVDAGHPRARAAPAPRPRSPRRRPCRPRRGPCSARRSTRRPPGGGGTSSSRRARRAACARRSARAAARPSGWALWTVSCMGRGSLGTRLAAPMHDGRDHQGRERPLPRPRRRALRRQVGHQLRRASARRRSPASSARRSGTSRALLGGRSRSAPAPATSRSTCCGRA